MPSTITPTPPTTTSSPGRLEIIRNNSNSWTVRKINTEARFPIVIGPGGTDYGALPPPEAIDNIKRFNQGRKSHWGGLSVYGDNPGFNFGFRQPFVWINLNDSNFKKYIKKFDSQGFPIGATIQDVTRISKFMLSGKGVFFALTQFPLQQQNAFNETRIWNPLSIITATSQKGLMGLIGRPTRHIEGGGGGFLGNIKAGLMSSVGLQSAKDKAKVPGIAKGAENLDNAGTPKSAISLQASLGDGIVQKGFIRGETGNRARSVFTEKWNTGDWGEGGNKTDKGSGFLAKLGSALISKIKSYIPSTTGRSSANWEIRAEYTDDNDKNVFSAMLADKRSLLSYSVKNFNNPTGTPYTVSRIHVYDGKNKNVYGKTPGVPGTATLTNLETLQSSLADGNFRPHERIGIPLENVVGNIVGNKRDARDISTEARLVVDTKLLSDSGIVGETDITKWAGAITRWHEMTPQLKPALTAEKFYHTGIRTYQQTVGSGKIDSYGRTKTKGDWESIGNKHLLTNVSSQNSHDPYNELGILSNSERSELFLKTNTVHSADTIFFYFHDLVNDKYIPFRATLTGISENTSANWDDVQYMGRADKLFTYNGFSREMNFAFSVYANSIRELLPMWKRINYLSGLTRPSKYTSGAGVMSGFIYPPLIKFRIGDLYVDQPAVISSVGVTVPDDATWETSRLGDSTSYGDYSYLTGTHQEIGMSKVQSRQLPTMVNISVSLKLLEKELAKTDNNLYFENMLNSVPELATTVEIAPASPEFDLNFGNYNSMVTKPKTDGWETTDIMKI